MCVCPLEGLGHEALLGSMFTKPLTTSSHDAQSITHGNKKPLCWHISLWSLALPAADIYPSPLPACTGYNVTRAMGVRLAKLSPTRGFAAELSTALIIMVASQYGLPTSSSQCITGGIIGVGLLEGFKVGVNWKLFAKIFCSWVSTLAVVGLATAAIFSQVRCALGLSQVCWDM